MAPRACRRPSGDQTPFWSHVQGEDEDSAAQAPALTRPLETCGAPRGPRAPFTTARTGRRPRSAPAVTCACPTLGPLDTSAPRKAGEGLATSPPLLLRRRQKRDGSISAPCVPNCSKLTCGPASSRQVPPWPRVLQKLGTYCAKPSPTAAATAAAPGVHQATSCSLGVARPLPSHATPGRGPRGILSSQQSLLDTCLLAHAATTCICGVRRGGVQGRRGGTASLLASPLLPRCPLGPTLLRRREGGVRAGCRGST